MTAMRRDRSAHLTEDSHINVRASAAAHLIAAPSAACRVRLRLELR